MHGKATMSVLRDKDRPLTGTMTRDLVSVVLPTWNRAYCVARTIDSVLAQTYSGIELIVIDDGSTDDTRDLILSRFGADPRVRYVYQSNSGVCAARNEGFRQSRGEYIALIDSDDAWEPWKIELQVACMKQRPEVGMVWTDMTAIDPDGSRISNAYLRRYYSAYQWFTYRDLFTDGIPLGRIARGFGPALPGTAFYSGDIAWAMIAGNLVHTPTVLLRRDRLKAAGGFNVEFQNAGEDYDFHLRICRAGPVGFIDAPSITYQVGRADQITHKHDVTMARNFLKVIQPILDKERHTIRLSPGIVRAVLSEAHAWLGACLVDSGEISAARQHLLTSMRYRPTARALYALGVSAIPPNLRPALRKCLRWLKQLCGGGHA